MAAIAIDLRMHRTSGIGTYLRNLIPLVVASYPKDKFYLLGRIDEMSNYSWAYNENVVLIDCRSPIYSVAEQLELFRKIPRDTTLFWSPHYNIPLLYSGRLLVTVHDVLHLAMPQYAEGPHKQFYAKGMFAALRYKADAILCDSNFTKNELVRLTGQGRQALYAIHIGLDESWFHVKKHQSPHPKPFLLFVGNAKPHKNLGRLVEAFEAIKDKIPHDLVIVGQRKGFITGDRTATFKAAAVGARVQFTDHVEDELVSQYFAHADALVLPSLYEGFGLPPLEAMACGCPVLVSDTASLPEICGDAALYCDPHSTKDIAHKIRQLMDDEGLREDLRMKGLERAKQFAWDKCAEQTLDVIEQVLQKKRES